MLSDFIQQKFYFLPRGILMWVSVFPGKLPSMKWFSCPGYLDLWNSHINMQLKTVIVNNCYLFINPPPQSLRQLIVQ